MSGPGDFTARLAKFVMSSEERFAAAKAIGKWRASRKRAIGHIASLKIACRAGGDLERNDWIRLCLIMAPDATPELCGDIWNQERFRRAGQTLRTRDAKPEWFAIIAGERIPTSLAVIEHFRRAHGVNFPIQFVRAEDDEGPPEVDS